MEALNGGHNPVASVVTCQSEKGASTTPKVIPLASQTLVWCQALQQYNQS